MFFAKEDKILTEMLRQEKGYKTKKFVYRRKLDLAVVVEKDPIKPAV